MTDISKLYEGYQKLLRDKWFLYEVSLRNQYLRRDIGVKILELERIERELVEAARDWLIERSKPIYSVSERRIDYEEKSAVDRAVEFDIRRVG